jgi:hypothetical protein
MNETNNEQNQKPRTSKLAIALIACIPAIFILFHMFFEPQSDIQKRMARGRACSLQLRSIHSAINIYGGEYNGMLPTADSWCDLLNKYVDSDGKTFKCPVAKEGRCNFAFNINVNEMKLDDIPPDVVLLFESEPGWNQVGGPELLTTENHEGTRCTILTAGGGTGFIKTEDLNRLRWEP